MGELAPGTVVAGYRIEMLIGRGGMGVVYRAVQSGLERVVALKVIAPELLDDEDVRRRFLSEARAAASVDHPNVIPVHDAGEDNGIAYIAMRYVDGDDLRTLVRRGGALDPAEAAHLIAQAGAALDAIHRAGLRAPRRQAREPARRSRPSRLLDGLRAGQGGADAHRRHRHRPVGRDARLRGSGADPRRPDRRARGRLRARRRPALRADGQGAVRARRRRGQAVGAAVRPAAGARRRCGAGCARSSTSRVARAMAKLPDDRYPSAGDLGRAARAAALGRSPTEPERMVARGAAAPDAAPTEPGLAAEAETRTALAEAAARAAAPLGAAARRRRADPRRRAAHARCCATSRTLAERRDDARPASTATATPTATATAAPPTPTATAAVVAKVRTVTHVGSRPSGIADRRR